MLSAFARAVESFFGPALQPSASLLRVAATVAMITILAASGWAALAESARRDRR